MNELYEANYILGLVKDEVSENDRVNYLTFIENDDSRDADSVFFILLSTLLQSIGTGECYTRESVKSRMETEFNALRLDSTLGAYTSYSPMVDLMFDLYQASMPYEKKYESYHDFIDAADGLPLAYKDEVYYAVLVALVRSQSLVRDLDFTTKVTDYVNNVTLSTDRSDKIASLISVVLVSITSESKV